jgi:hypothetical protein
MRLQPCSMGPRPSRRWCGRHWHRTPRPLRSPTHSGSHRWQMWHVRAEALRQVRTVDMPAEHAAALVDLLIDEVLDRRSIALAAPHHGIEEPEVLRRVDGSSVYTAAGAELYTLQRILDAEQRLVTHRRTTRRVSRRSQAIDLALLEMANGPQPMLGRLRWSAGCAPPRPSTACDRRPNPEPGRRTQPPCQSASR